jgi:hypothetical protein
MTSIAQRPARGAHTLTIGATRGRFAGMPSRRTFVIRAVNVRRPSAVTVNGRRRSNWSYNEGTDTATIRVTAPARRATRIALLR